MGMSDTMTLTATITAIDYDTRMITLQGPEGNTLTTRVDESAKRFNDVKRGDQVVVRITRAFAIMVRQPWRSAGRWLDTTTSSGFFSRRSLFSGNLITPRNY